MNGGEGGSGVILVRAWIQDNRLVARVAWSLPGDPGLHTEVVLGVDAVEQSVKRWLGLLVADDGEDATAR